MLTYHKNRILRFNPTYSREQRFTNTHSNSDSLLNKFSKAVPSIYCPHGT